MRDGVRAGPRPLCLGLAISRLIHCWFGTHSFLPSLLIEQVLCAGCLGTGNTAHGPAPWWQQVRWAVEEVLVETVTLTSLELDTGLGTDPWDLESTS